MPELLWFKPLIHADETDSDPRYPWRRCFRQAFGQLVNSCWFL